MGEKLDSEYLRDYFLKEYEEWEKVKERILKGKFDFKNEIYPPASRFTKIQEPITTLSAYGLNDLNDILAQVPFSGSVVINLTPLKEKDFNETFFDVKELPQVIDFALQTGKIQFVLGGYMEAYESLDYLKPVFEKLKPPVYFGLPTSLWADSKKIEEIKTQFLTIVNKKYLPWYREQYTAEGYSDQQINTAFSKKLATYCYLKSQKISIVDEIERLFSTDPEKANHILNLCKSYIVENANSLLSHSRNYSLTEEKEATLFKIPGKEIALPCEIGKFLFKKLTYAPLGIDACKELMYHYDEYDLKGVQQALSTGIKENKIDIVETEAEGISEILDNVWKDKTISNRIKVLRGGIPFSMAIIGSLAAGPIGTAGGFLAGLGYTVADKFIDLGTDTISEKIGKFGAKTYLANVFDFKRDYAQNIRREK